LHRWDQIQVVARFSNVPNTNVAKFKELAARVPDITNGEAGALSHVEVFPSHFQGK
jgi:hypothetical protein